MTTTSDMTPHKPPFPHKADDLPDLPEVLRQATMAADMAALGAQTGTLARMVKVAVTRAFEAALANGLIQLTPREDWPAWVVLDPPYTWGIPE